MKFKMFMTVIGDSLQIRLGRSEEKFDGAVVKTLVKDDVSVGVTANLLPVFVRVEDTQNDSRMVAVRAKILANRAITQDDKDQVFSYATKRMRVVYNRYRAKIAKQVSLESGKLAQEYRKRATKRFNKMIVDFSKASVSVVKIQNQYAEVGGH